MELHRSHPLVLSLPYRSEAASRRELGIFRRRTIPVMRTIVTMDEVEQRLRAEAAAARERFDALTADLQALIAAASGSNLDDEHDPEGATIAFEREQLAAFREQARQQLDDIAEALRRLAAGAYGRCATCGAPIAEARLMARPFVRECVTCAARRR
jgi:RNA polymerase-binding transcription factor DksA